MIKKLAYYSCCLIITYLFSAMTCTLASKKTIIYNTKEQNTISSTTNQKELRVGMLRSLSNQYIDYRNPNEVGGFEYALLKKFAHDSNLKLKIVIASTPAELIKNSRQGKIDLIAAEIKGYTSEINNFYASEPFHYSTQQLVYLKGSVKPSSFSDIKGNLTVQKSSLQSYILSDIKQKYPALTWYESTMLNQEKLLRLVVDKRIDYTIANNRTIAIMRQIYPSLTVAFDVAKRIPSTWYIPKSKGNILLHKLNQFIAKSREDGTIAKFEYHYFNYMNKFDYVDIQAFNLAIEQTLPTYRAYFEKYAKVNNIDWKLLAAMSYQESHWDPNATSATGVRGMMMLTKSTADSLALSNRLDAEQSIKGGAMYLNQILDRIPQSIAKEERIWFALAAYNVGLGHLLDARALAKKLNKNPDSWLDIRGVLPLLSEEEYYSELKYGFARGYQAVHFVDNIQQYYMTLVGYMFEQNYRQKNIKENKTSAIYVSF